MNAKRTVNPELKTEGTIPRKISFENRVANKYFRIGFQKTSWI
jgi:hypothetical protein